MDAIRSGANESQAAVTGEVKVTDIAADIAAQRRAIGPDCILGMRLPDRFDPRAIVDRYAGDGLLASYERPDRDLTLAAFGDAGSAEMSPGAGPTSLRADAQALLCQPSSVAELELRPRLLGGFAFRSDVVPGGPWEGFPAGRLTLPRVLFVREAGVSGVVLAPGVMAEEVEPFLAAAALLLPQLPSSNGRSDSGPSDNGRSENGRGAEGPAALRLHTVSPPDRETWLAAVATVASEVRSGLYEKAVLACTMQLESSVRIDVGAALARLRTDYPHCHLFSVAAGESTFFGASPESLVSRRRNVVSALGLAGSAPRGNDDEEDRALGEELLHSAKDRIEHEIVVRAIREGLQDVTTELRAPNQPELLRLRNIQHLSTEVLAKARDGVDVLDLVERLHPTPAVCGWPTSQARSVIDSHERWDRGWYAGPVGWIDGDGDGEFVVALRSALARGNHAWLFAGAGIMGDSEPEDEFEEIELKFRPLAGALAGNGLAT